MAIQSDADLDFMLKDAGVPVSLGGASTFGILTRQDLLEPDGQGGVTTVRRRVLTIREGTLPGLADDVAVIAGGTNYRVRTVLDSETRLTRVTLA